MKVFVCPADREVMTAVSKSRGGDDGATTASERVIVLRNVYCVQGTNPTVLTEET